LIGNAVADVLADRFTGTETQQADTAEIPMGYNNRRWMLQNTQDYEWLTVPVRKKLRKDRETKVEAKCKGEGSQNKAKNDSGNLTALLKHFKKPDNGHNRAVLTRPIVMIGG
jgi:hypothetical protein